MRTLVGLLTLLSVCEIYAQNDRYGNFLNLELEQVTSPSELVKVIEFQPFIDFHEDKNIRILIENKTLFELYFVEIHLIYKDLSGVPIYNYSSFFDGEGQVEYMSSRWTDSIPPNTIGIINGMHPAGYDWTGEARIINEAKTVVASITWKQDVEPLTGDLDRDGEVDFDDFFIFVDNFGKRITQVAAKSVAFSSMEQENLRLRGELKQLKRAMESPKVEARKTIPDIIE